MRVYHRRGGLIGKNQNRVAREEPLPGDVGASPPTMFLLLLARRRRPECEVGQAVDLTTIDSESAP